MEWRVDWTTDDENWLENWFSTLDEAREFANELVSKNEQNPKFWTVAYRLCVVRPSDFFDDIPAKAIRLV